MARLRQSKHAGAQSSSCEHCDDYRERYAIMVYEYAQEFGALDDSARRRIDAAVRVRTGCRCRHGAMPVAVQVEFF